MSKKKPLSLADAARRYLALKSDREKSRLLGGIFRRKDRRKRKIIGGTEVKLWASDEKKLLGTMRDEVLAKLLRRTFQAVRAMRKRSKIPCYNRMRKLWSADDDKLLGTKPDAELAKQLERTFSSVRTRRIEKGIHITHSRYIRWTWKMDKLLGQLPDKEIARRVGCAVISVFTRRHRLGIKASSRSRSGRFVVASKAKTPKDRSNITSP